ncbi:MAG TPA: hypothetical protein PK752_20505, partial [Accumulibacter sp.]|uniref:hypothetical protein n=1 Tax=Accumulibacter sp. TaxID=2053492 RepID=UPI002BAA0B59
RKFERLQRGAKVVYKDMRLTPSAAKAGVTGKRCRFGGVMRQGWLLPAVLDGPSGLEYLVADQ